MSISATQESLNGIELILTSVMSPTAACAELVPKIITSSEKIITYEKEKSVFLIVITRTILP